MANRIFFSWQSDTPTGLGRNFLKSTLEDACRKIGSNTEIDESLRDVYVDSDTQGVAGQPPIVDTILKKIDKAGVFVADMTFVGTSIGARLSPNPNVLIEYGYALKSLGHERVICLMNTAYGEPSEQNLPFNLRHVRWPISYYLPETATPDEKEKEKAKLVEILDGAIRASLMAVPAEPTPPLPSFPKAIAKDGPARFRAKGEELGFYEGFRRGPAVKVFLNNTKTAMWLRVIPATPPGREWTPREIREVAKHNGGLHILPLIHGSGADWLRAEDGWGVYVISGEPREETAQRQAHGVVFVFQTGEIWSVDTALLDYTDNSLPLVEEYFNLAFQQYVSFLAALGVNPPYVWEAGLTGIKGRECDVPVAPGRSRLSGWHGPLCLSDTIQVEGTYKAGQTTAVALLPFYKKIFEKCGVERPQHLT